MKKNNLFGSIILLLLFSSCDKGELNLNNTEGKIKEILNEEMEVIGSYTYTSNGLLKESWHAEEFYTDNEKATYTYTYNSEGQLISKKGYEPGIVYMSSYTGAMGKDVDYSYEYDTQNKIVKIIVDYDYNSEMTLDYGRQTVFQYPEESVVIVAANYIDPAANSIAGYMAYHFNRKGNIEKTISYYKISPTEERISEETIYTYDNKKTPFQPEPGPVSKNNVLSKRMTAYTYDENGNRSIAYTSDYTYEYTYNELNYPDCCTEIRPNGTKNKRYFKYE